MQILRNIANGPKSNTVIRFLWESGLSSASRNHLTTFCRPCVHYACLRLCSAIVHFIQNSFLYFVCFGWSAHALTALATLPVSVAWLNCCTSSKTAVVNIEALRHLIMFQQGKRKTKSLLDFYTQKNKSFLAYFMRILNSCVVQQDSCTPASPAAHFLCSTARIQHDISAASFCSCKLLWRSDECVLLPCFNAQPDIFAVTNSCLVAMSVCSSNILTWGADSLYSVQWHIK